MIPRAGAEPLHLYILIGSASEARMECTDSVIVMSVYPVFRWSCWSRDAMLRPEFSVPDNSLIVYHISYYDIPTTRLSQEAGSSPGKYRLPFFDKRLDTFACIGRSRSCGKRLRLLLQLALQRSVTRLGKQALDRAIRLGGTRSQFPRHSFRLALHRTVRDHEVDQSQRQGRLGIPRLAEQEKTSGARNADSARHGGRRSAIRTKPDLRESRRDPRRFRDD